MSLTKLQSACDNTRIGSYCDGTACTLSGNCASLCCGITNSTCTEPVSDTCIDDSKVDAGLAVWAIILISVLSFVAMAIGIYFLWKCMTKQKKERHVDGVVYVEQNNTF